jgi:hypothetical protein
MTNQINFKDTSLSPDMEKVAGTAGTPAEPPAKNTLRIKYPFASL